MDTFNNRLLANYKYGRSEKDVAKFTEGGKKILYCKNNLYPCTKCKDKKNWLMVNGRLDPFSHIFNDSERNASDNPLILPLHISECYLSP